jgi:hypothetical protein
MNNYAEILNADYVVTYCTPKGKQTEKRIKGLQTARAFAARLAQQERGSLIRRA